MTIQGTSSPPLARYQSATWQSSSLATIDKACRGLDVVGALPPPAGAAEAHKREGWRRFGNPRQEFEEGQTLAGRFMQDLDKIESSFRWPSMNSVLRVILALASSRM